MRRQKELVKIARINADAEIDQVQATFKAVPELVTNAAFDCGSSRGGLGVAAMPVSCMRGSK